MRFVRNIVWLEISEKNVAKFNNLARMNKHLAIYCLPQVRKRELEEEVAAPFLGIPADDNVDSEGCDVSFIVVVGFIVDVSSHLLDEQGEESKPPMLKTNIELMGESISTVENIMLSYQTFYPLT